MKLSANVIIQILGITLQILTYSTTVVPPKAQPILGGAIAIVQAITGVVAHFYNTDGTPQSVAYVEPTVPPPPTPPTPPMSAH